MSCFNINKKAALISGFLFSCLVLNANSKHPLDKFLDYVRISTVLPFCMTRQADHSTIVDPFSNESSIGTITNDLNPEFDTNYHLYALEFLRMLPDSIADIVLFDSPYSLTRAAQFYKNYGKDKLDINVGNMCYWSNCKNEVARIIKLNGYAILFGWNSNAIGINCGFQMIELLLIPHGGSKNDTIVTVESKIVHQLNMEFN